MPVADQFRIVSDEYQLYAADCMRLAQASPDPHGEAILRMIGQAWMKLAEQATGSDHGPDLPHQTQSAIDALAADARSGIGPSATEDDDEDDYDVRPRIRRRSNAANDKPDAKPRRRRMDVNELVDH